MIYICSDLHGCFNIFKKFYNTLDLKNNKLIINGDCIDRGNNSAPLVDFIISHDNVELILGNHEYYYLNCFNIIEDNLKDGYLDLQVLNSYSEVFLHWIQNGGNKTVESFNKFNKLYKRNLYKDFYIYLQKCKKYLIVNNNLIIHANPNIEPIHFMDSISLRNYLKSLNDYDLFENRDFSDKTFIKDVDICNPNYNIFVGHTPITYYERKPLDGIRNSKFIRLSRRFGTKIVNTDLGVFLTKSLCFYNLSRDRYFYNLGDNLYKSDINTLKSSIK